MLHKFLLYSDRSPLTFLPFAFHKYMRNGTHRMENTEGKEVKLKTFEQSGLSRKWI